MAKARLVLVSMTSNDVASAAGDSASPEVGLLFPDNTLIVIRYPTSASPRLEVFADATPPSMYEVSGDLIEVDDGVLENARQISRRSSELLESLLHRLKPAIVMREDIVHAGHLKLVQDSRRKSG